MKDFIAKIKGSHLLILTAVSIATAFFAHFYVESLKTSLLGAVAYVTDYPGSRSVIISTKGGSGSVIAEGSGTFRLPLVGGLSVGDTIHLVLKEKDKKIDVPLLGEYTLRSDKSFLKLQVSSNSDLKSLYNSGSISPFSELIISQNNSLTRSSDLTASSDNKKKKHQGHFQAPLQSVDDYYNFPHGTSEKSTKEEAKRIISDKGAYSEQLVLDSKIVTGDKQYKKDVLSAQFSRAEKAEQQFLDGKIGKKAIFSEKLKLAKLFYYYEEYQKSVDVYEEIRSANWAEGENLGDIKSRILNAKFMLYLSSGSRYPDELEASYLKQLKHWQVMESRDYVAEAFLANDLAYLISIKTSKESQLRALKLLNGVSERPVKEDNPELWLAILNNKLAIIIDLAKDCNTENLDVELHSILIHLNKAKIKNSVALMDIPYNVINAVSRQGDCSVGRSSVKHYVDAFSVLDNAIESEEFSTVATSAQKLVMKSKYCDLKRRISDLKPKEETLKLLKESVACYQEMLTNPSEYAVSGQSADVADLQGGLGYSFHRLGMQQTGSERFAQLEKSNYYLLKASRYYKNQPDEEIFYYPAINAYGFNLINIADASGAPPSERKQVYLEAKEMISQAYNYDKTSASYIDSLAWAEFKLGNIEKAKELFLQALESVKNRRDKIEIRAHLSELYLSIGDYDNARVEIEQVRKANPQAIEIEHLEEKFDLLKNRLE